MGLGPGMCGLRSESVPSTNRQYGSNTRTTTSIVKRTSKRLGGRAPERITSDEWSAYPEAILRVFGAVVTPPRTGKPGRPAGPRVEPPAGTCYATVHKEREKGRVVSVEQRVVFGEAAGGVRGVGQGRVGEHVVSGAAERHGPAPQRTQGAQDVPVLEGVEGA
jgi:hypothetical protein